MISPLRASPPLSELPAIDELEDLLDHVTDTLRNRYPHVGPPDWSTTCEYSPAAHIAQMMIALIDALEQTIEVYRDAIAPEGPSDPSSYDGDHGPPDDMPF